MGGTLVYDISIWEEIRPTVKRKTDELIEGLLREIPQDLSLVEYHGTGPVPWQLREVMRQRARSWVQSVYDICCEARKDTTNVPSLDFDRAVWAYCIEPFIMGQRRSSVEKYSMSVLLDLLFTAVGVPPNKRALLNVAQRDSCLEARRHIYEAWSDQLHHRPSRLDEAVAAMSRYQALERRAQRMAAGLPPEPPTAPTPVSTPVQSVALKETPATAATWDAIEILFLSDERVQIRRGTKSETLNYAEFGFEDGRSGKPIEAWAILREMAKNNGFIRDVGSTGKMWPVVEKQVQNIRKILRAHFGVSTDPIPFVSGVGYKSCFKIGCKPSFNT